MRTGTSAVVASGLVVPLSATVSGIVNFAAADAIKLGLEESFDFYKEKRILWMIMVHVGTVTTIERTLSSVLDIEEPQDEPRPLFSPAVSCTLFASGISFLVVWIDGTWLDRLWKFAAERNSK